MTKPITPEEIDILRAETFPSEVCEAFNELIVETFQPPVGVEMSYGDFYGWICGCGAEVKAKNGSLPGDWHIAWPESHDEYGWDTTPAFPPPGIYCEVCWAALPDEPHTAEIDNTGQRYRAALMDHGKDRNMATDIQRCTCERLALGKRYEDIAGTNHEGIRKLISAGLHQRCFPSGPPPDLSGITMILHPSAVATGIHTGLYDYLNQFAKRYDQTVHLFWDKSRWFLVFIGGFTAEDDEEALDAVLAGDQKSENIYNTGKCEFWIAFYPNGTHEILGAS